MAAQPGPMGTRSIGLVGILGGLAGQVGVLDLLADVRGGGRLGDECVSSWTEVYAMCCNRWDDLGGKPPINSSSTALARNRAMLRRGI